MIVYIQEERLEFDNEPNKIQKYFDEINKMLIKKDLQLSHLVIDDQPVYENFYDYFIQNIVKIEKVVVVIQNVETLVNETIVSTFKYLDNGIPMVKGLAEEFYQLPDKNSWQKLNNLFEGIQWIIETVTQIDSIKNLDQFINHYETWNEYVQNVNELIEIVTQIEEAMVNKDNILLGDLLLYEVVAIFEKLHEKLRFLLPKAVSNDVG